MEALTSDELAQIDFFICCDIMILIDYMENEKKIMQTAINFVNFPLNKSLLGPIPTWTKWTNVPWTDLATPLQGDSK